jgi:Arc/MetJ family transcription regulator
MTGIRKSTRLQITVDDDLLSEAMKLSGASSTRDVIEQSLSLLVRQKRKTPRARIRGFLAGLDTGIDRSGDRDFDVPCKHRESRIRRS